MSNYQFISQPVPLVSGDIFVPGDKSMSHRAVILGSIAQGKTTIYGYLDSEDCRATIQAMQLMGVNIDDSSPQFLTIYGQGKHRLCAPSRPIDCGNSGTSMRLLAGLLAAQPFDSMLIGDDSLSKRPMARISAPLQQMKANITTTLTCPPICITKAPQLIGIEYTLPIASAQIKSCLLLAGMYAQHETVLTELQTTRNHTELMLQAFSYPIKCQDNRITINNLHECQATTIHIPGDLSSAAFFMVAATILPDSNITIKRVGINPTRTGVIQILQAMGANIVLTHVDNEHLEPVAYINVRSAALKGIDISPTLVSLAIDEFPIIFIAAACAKGRTTLKKAEELRHKESDRIQAMVTGLRCLGIEITDHQDGVVIHGGDFTGGEVDSFNDHRIAMAFAIAGAKAQAKVYINQCQNVATSFPDFLDKAHAVGLNIQGKYHHE